MDNLAGNKTIAKNTVFLYLRMTIVMLVTLYTSRVVLKELGVNDYGIYQAVGGVAGFIAFINNALSTGTSRFITFALGQNDGSVLRKTFSTALSSHIVLGLLIVLIAETVGLWYVKVKMVIPEERFTAALAVYQISILTTFISIIQVPFYAEVIAHEKMSVFAYAGIAEAVSKLGIVCLLSLGGVDKLVLYAMLLLLIHICIFCFYVFYSRRNFKESSFRLGFDKELFGQLFSFSGWSLFANGSIALSNQGILLLLNQFFSPAVVAARSISLQVNNAASSFVQNFRTAANPQIVKRYAADDLAGSKALLLESTKFSFFLMLLIALPLFFLAEPLLYLWLVEVPEYTVTFLQIVVLQSLFQVFDTSFYTALYTKGRIKENAIVSPLIVFLCFPVVYLLFKSGSSPLALSWAYLACYAILGLFVKPLLLNKICGYNWKEISGVFGSCLLVTIAAVPIPLLIYQRMGVDTLAGSITALVVSLAAVAIAVWFFGINQRMRDSLILAIKKRGRV